MDTGVQIRCPFCSDMQEREADSVTSSIVLLILLLYAVLMYLISRRTRNKIKAFEIPLPPPTELHCYC